MIAAQLVKVEAQRRADQDAAARRERSAEMAARGSRSDALADEARAQTLLVREAKLRRRFARCLKMIRGGRDALYFELKERLAATAVDRVCATLKATRFPILTQRSDAGAPRDLGAVKAPLFRCMCEFRGV